MAQQKSIGNHVFVTVTGIAIYKVEQIVVTLEHTYKI